MPLTNYGELKAAVADWLARADLADRVPDFIRLAEADLNGRLRLRAMETGAILTIDAAAVALPADLLAIRRLTIAGVALSYVTPHARAALFGGGRSGRPLVYTIEGGDLLAGPAPDGSYAADLAYVAAVPALAADGDTTAVLAANPDIYLYGALAHAAPFIGDDERVAVWRGAYEAALQRAVAADRQARVSGSPLVMRGGLAV